MPSRLAVLLTLSLSTLTHAVECARPDGASGSGVAARSTEERLAFLQKTFSDEQTYFRRWLLAFGGGFSLLTMGQVALSTTATTDEKPDWYFGALSSLVGAVTVTANGAMTLQKLSGFSAAGVTDENACAVLAEGERRLREGAQQEAFGTQWWSHVVNVLFNVGFGLLYWQGYGHLRTAIVNTAVGTVLGEGMLLFQPRGLVHGLEAYLGTGQPQAVQWHLFPAGVGVGFALTW